MIKNQLKREIRNLQQDDESKHNNVEISQEQGQIDLEQQADEEPYQNTEKHNKLQENSITLW